MAKNGPQNKNVQQKSTLWEPIGSKVTMSNIGDESPFFWIKI